MSSLLISLSLRPSLSILFFAKPNNTRYQNPRFLLVLQSSMAMTASAIWQPQEDGLREICGLLRQHISPTSNKPQIWQQLQHSQFPDFDNYLVFILARAKDLMMFDENEKLLSRNPPNIHHVNNTSMELRCGVNGTESDIVQACQRAAEDQANYFGNLQKGVLLETLDRLPTGMQATTLLELMTIRAFHSQILRCYSLGTTIGFRIRRGNLTDILAILVFVARKVHWQWLSHIQCLPSTLEGPGGVWCDVDVVEFSYFGAPTTTPKEQLYTELVDGLSGSDLCIGSGSQERI